MLASALSVALASQGFADALVRSNAMKATTIAEIFVTAEGAVVELEIGGDDLPAFRHLLPDAIYEGLGNAPRPLVERLATFFDTDFVIAPGDAPALRGVVEAIGPRERVPRDAVTGEPLDAAEAGTPEPVVAVRIRYRFASRPDVLVFSAPPGTSVGFVVYHDGIAVNDFRYLTRGVALELDWDDPWYSHFQTRSMRRQYFAPMTGFLYVEPYEVRKEIIVRPFDLQQWVDLGLEGRDTIPVEIQPELKRRAAEFLRAHHPVEIDGEAVPGDLARIHFIERTLRTSRVIEPPEDLDVHAAVLGAIFVYPTAGLPQRVTMDWDLWSERLDRIPVASVDQAGPLPTILDPSWRVLEWQNFLQQPELPTLVEVVPPPGATERFAADFAWGLLVAASGVLLWSVRDLRRRAPAALALILATAAAFSLGEGARVDEERGREVVQALLHNVYRAFDHRDEGRIYDVLERSASGDLLEQLYLETRRGLVLASQGGARAKVKEIELEALEVTSTWRSGFTAEATWVVGGSVGHWGHVHSRRNRVRADLVIESIDESWVLTDVSVVEEERIQPARPGGPMPSKNR